MRVGEMRQREDFDRVLVDTLATAWSDERRQKTSVTLDGVGQRWRLQPMLSAYYTANVGPTGRRFMRDAFRFSPRATRLVPQFLLGSLVTTPVGLRLAATPGFVVDPPIERDGDIVVVPGNRRVRIFDFARGICRVVGKKGFDLATMQREIDVRTRNVPGLFLPLIDYAADGSWFTEVILEGYPLPRCPPWFDRRGLERLARRRLAAWTDASAESTSAGALAATLGSQILDRLGAASRSNPRVEGWVRTLVAIATRMGEVEVGETHGDFQAGNVFVTGDGTDIVIIDWEHSARRSRHYDVLVQALATRSGLQLAKHLEAFIAGSVSGPLGVVPVDSAWRKGVLALFALEDLVWYLRESFDEFVGPSPGLTWWLDALGTFGDRLERLFGETSSVAEGGT